MATTTTYSVQEDGTYIEYSATLQLRKGSYTGRWVIELDGKDVGWVVTGAHGWNAYANRQTLGHEYDGAGKYQGMTGYLLADGWDTRKEAVEYFLTALHDKGITFETTTRLGEPEWAARLKSFQS